MADAASGASATEAQAFKKSRPFSAFERMVAWRYLRSRRKEAFISVIAGFSFIGNPQPETSSRESAAAALVAVQHLCTAADDGFLAMLLQHPLVGNQHPHQ